MENRHYNQITQAEWDVAEEAYKSRYRVPERISDEQARAQFAMIARSALYSVTVQYANHHRRSQGLGVLRQPHIPSSLSRWIDDTISAIDDNMGRPGASYYQKLVNDLLMQLQRAEHHFLKHGS